MACDLHKTPTADISKPGRQHHTATSTPEFHTQSTARGERQTPQHPVVRLTSTYPRIYFGTIPVPRHAAAAAVSPIAYDISLRMMSCRRTTFLSRSSTPDSALLFTLQPARKSVASLGIQPMFLARAHVDASEVGVRGGIRPDFRGAKLVDGPDGVLARLVARGEAEEMGMVLWYAGNSTRRDSSAIQVFF